MKIVPQVGVSRLPEIAAPAAPLRGETAASLPTETYVPQLSLPAPQAVQGKVTQPASEPTASPAVSPAPASSSPAPDRLEQSDEGEWRISDPKTDKSKESPRFPGDGGSGDDGPGLGGGYFRVASSPASSNQSSFYCADNSFEGDGPSLGGGYFTNPRCDLQTPAEYCDLPYPDFAGEGQPTSPAPALLLPAPTRPESETQRSS